MYDGIKYYKGIRYIIYRYIYIIVINEFNSW